MNPEKLLAIRAGTGLNQTDFWARVGVSQSAGSRYESGRNPAVKSLVMLLLIAYGTSKQATKIMNHLREGNTK